jgi:hypothetical protein
MSLQDLFKLSSPVPVQPEAMVAVQQPKATVAVQMVEKALTPAIDILLKPAPLSPAGFIRSSAVEKQELLRHSLLTSSPLLPPQSLTKNQLISLVGQIHADQFAMNNFIEQLPSHLAAAWWVIFIKKVQETPVPPELIRALEQYAAISAELATLRSAGEAFKQRVIEASQKFTQRIQNLQIGESFLLEGGYHRGNVDCPTAFEFVRISPTHFDLFVYSTGEENSGHQKVQETSGKKWHYMVVHYQSVPNECLFIGDKPHLFVQSLLTARFGTYGASAPLVHIGLLAHLQRYRYNRPLPLSTRRALTGAWSHLKGCILRKMRGDARVYRTLILEIKLHSLVHGYNQFQKIPHENNVEAEQLRIVLRKGGQLLFKTARHFRAYSRDDSRSSIFKNSRNSS